MKTRSGFVSNSSSSSFLLGVAKIVDLKLFMPWYDKIKKSYYDSQVGVVAYNVSDGNLYGGEISEKGFECPTPITYKYSSAKVNGRGVIIDSFQSDLCLSVDKLNDIDPDCFKYVFYVSIDNNEGDGAFGNDGWDIDYDIHLGFLPEDQQDIYSDLMSTPEKVGLAFAEATYGAGRNG